MKERLSLFISEVNRRHGITYFFMGLLIFLSASSGAFAQTAQISGRITDSSQAAVVGSSIRLTNVDTGEHRHSVSIDSGYYTFPSLLPGHYSIKVSKEGFDELERGGITVETGKTSTIDVTLSVGHIAQSVVVNADAPLLQTDSAAVAGVVENKTIVNMPLVDRRTAQLQRLNGFVVQNGTGSSVLGGSGGASFALAGGRGNNAYYMIDGNNAQNVLLGVPVLAFDPPVESIQEFNVAISNYSAELGRSGGGIIQITTKSGTNSFHGSAYEYLRNDALDARTYFAKSKPKRRFNLFGATFGGPLQKDKTWFFGNYEGRRQNTASANVLNVPTALEATGDFSDQSTPILDPRTGQPFALNKIPQSRLDKVGLALASFYPTPNVAGELPGKANFIANDPVISTVDDYVVRVDHSFSDKDRAFFRSLGELGTATTATIFPTPGTDQYGYVNKSYYVNSAASWTHTFSPLALNIVRVGFVINQNEWLSAGAGSGINGQIGLSGVNPAFFPQVTVNGYEPLGNATQKRIQGPVKSTEVVDAFTWIRGRHQLQFGGAYHNAINPDNEYLPTAGGAFTFNAIGTGNSIASLLLGRVYQASILQTEDLDTRASTVGLFIQDDWHVTPRLTLNVGLRYDIDQPRYEIHNRQNGFDANAINPVSGTPGVVTFSGKDGLSKYANNWDLHNYGPRLGFAWNVTPGWVIRGGGGILYTPEYYGATPIVASTGFSKQGTFVSPDNGVTPAFQLANGMPTVEFPATSDLTPGYGAVPVGTTPNTSITYFKRDRTTGYLYQSNLDVQHEISNNLVVDIGYLGTFGHHLSSMTPQSVNQVPTNELGPGNAQARRPFPQFSNVQILEPDIGASNYHGVNVGLQKRYSRGLQLQADYTFAKFIDNVDSMSELAGYPANVFTNYYDRRSDRGLSGNDVRNRLIVSTVYDLPFGHGRLIEPSNRVIGTALGGWTIGAIAEFRSGTPLSPFELTNNTGSFSDGVRPNIIGATSLPGDRSKAAKVAQWFNTSAFSAPPAYTFGNAGRTFGTGPGAANLDASLLKNFRVGDRTIVQFRTEALNVINRANFANPNTLQGSPTFGQITYLASGNQARIIQLGLHLAF